MKGKGEPMQTGDILAQLVAMTQNLGAGNR
jgi:hypothetical protein